MTSKELQLNVEAAVLITTVNSECARVLHVSHMRLGTTNRTSDDVRCHNRSANIAPPPFPS
jgi:hypothetical protein